MRVYKFLDSDFALKSLLEKRLKISRIDDLNDPFELIPYDLSSQHDRLALQKTREQLALNRGLLCFSDSWHDPVIWAHYSDKHRGISLGFEIPSGADLWKRVSYVSQRLPFPRPIGFDDVKKMLFTKFSSWKYEREIRMWVALDEEQEGLYFYSFGKNLRLVEVIAGARCTVPETEIRQCV